MVFKNILFFESIVTKQFLLCAEKDRKIENKHINKPQFVEQQQHPCKFANAVKTERHTSAKNKDKDAFQNT